jgi:hypothetical protein
MIGNDITVVAEIEEGSSKLSLISIVWAIAYII